MPDKPIKILIADDQDLVRSGYRAILSTYPQFDIVGMAKDGEEAVTLAQTLKPDVVLMDVRMPNKNGIEATRDITNNPLMADTHVLVLTTFDVTDYAYDALKAGASGFLLKDAEPEDIAHAIEVVAEGNALVEPSVMKRMIEAFTSSSSKTAGGVKDSQQENILKTLTERELEILKLVAKGMSNDEIASELFISVATVKTHVSRLLAKTGTHDRSQLVVFAYENGVVSPGA